jgi:excisionase family DNA binding protein
MEIIENLHESGNYWNETMDKLLTATEVADYLRISPSYAYQLMRRGEIPTIALGRAVRVHPHDLADFIKSRTSHPQITGTDNSQHQEKGLSPEDGGINNN